MKKILVFLKKNWIALALVLIILGAFFVRSYNFDKWLYFKMDQSRDALLMSNALEKGPGYLPLLGPRAGAVELKHGFLRLGPAYYYFQYIAGKLAGSTDPQVFAYPDLFFSIAVIPLLFFFLRLYFDKKNSLMITAMYAFSFLIIQYSRFAWNPNSLQFFIILSFYGLLRFLNDQKVAAKRWWLALWIFGITIGSQLHFFGFFSLLGISGLLILSNYSVWKKETIKSFFKKEVLKQFATFAGIALAVFLVLYAPVIISDSMNGGQNTKNFFEAMGSKAEKKPITEKLKKDVEENLGYYCLLTTSDCYNGYGGNPVAVSVTGLIMLAGLFLAIKNLRSERKQLSKDFLMLTLFWFGVFSILTIPVAFQLRPRFYIVVFALPFIFLGLAYEFLEKRFGKKAVWASLFITVMILAVNMRGTLLWFKEQASAQEKTTTIKRTLILKNKDGVTLGQLQGVTDWMYARLKKGNNLYYYVKPEHERPINFLLTNKKDDGLKFSTMKINEDPNAQFFAITPAKNGLEPVIKKFGENIAAIDSQQFGQLLVSEIVVANREVSPTFKFKDDGGGEDRTFWKDVFNSQTNKKK